MVAVVPALVTTPLGPVKTYLTPGVVLDAVSVTVLVQFSGPLAIRLRFWGVSVEPMTVVEAVAVHPLGAVATTE